MRKRYLPISFNQQELRWGIRYLMFQLVFLGPLLTTFLPKVFPGIRSIHINAIYFAINFLSVLWIFRVFLITSVKKLPQTWAKVLILTATGLLLYFVSTKLIGKLTHAWMPDFKNQNNQAVQNDLQTNWMLTMINTVILAPLAEEVLYRGLVFGAIHRRSPILGYLISALLFSMIHIPGNVYASPLYFLISLLQYLPAGLILAGAYDFSGNILTPIFIHTIINIFATVLLR